MAADDLANEMYRRSHGSARLGRVGALEILAAVVRFSAAHKLPVSAT